LLGVRIGGEASRGAGEEEVFEGSRWSMIIAFEEPVYDKEPPYHLD
jgi:hypothetical protein